MRKNIIPTSIEIWIAVFLILGITLLLALSFPIFDKFDWFNILSEGAIFFAILGVYFYIIRYKIIILDIGWFIFALSILFDFLDEFFMSTGFFSRTIGQLLTPIGLFIAMVGFIKLANEKQLETNRRKQIENSLKASEEMYRLLFGNAPDAFYIIDLKGNFIDGNKAAEKMIGVDKSELIGKNMLKIGFLPINQLPKAAKALARNILGKSTGPDEFTLQRRDGSQIDIEIRTHPVKIKNKAHVLSIARDISERRIHEKDIQKNAFRRGKLLEISRELSSSLDLQFILDKSTKLALELFESSGATIYLLSSDKQSLKPAITYDPNETAVMSQEVSVKSSLSGKVVKAKQGKAFNNASQNPDAYQIPGTSENDDEHLMVLPLLVENEVMGTLNIYRRAKLYEDEDIELAETFVLYVSRAIQNSQAHRDLVNEIKERKNAEEIIKESEEKYRLLIDNIPDVTWSTDINGRTNFISSNVKDVYGYTSEEIFKGGEKLWFGRVHKEDLQKLKNAYKAFFKENKEYDTEYRIKHKNGKWIWLHDRAIMHDNTGKNKYAYGVFSDVTARKLAEEEIYRLSRAVKQSANSIVITDKQGLIEYVNPSFEKITGYSAKEAIGTNPRFLKSGETPKEEYATLWDTITSGNDWIGEFHNRKKNGELYWESATISPIKNKAGEIMHFLGIKEDITERKKAVEEREGALMDAERANQIKSNFLANMSHEIRTPLNAILGFTDLIESETTKMNNPELDQYVNIIQQSGDRLMNTVHGILDISQIETGTVKLNPEPVNIKQTITDLITILKPSAQEKKVDIHFDSHIRKSIIQTDKYCLTQAIDNILNNAIKYTEKGSVTVHLQHKGEKLIASVTDTGIGMAEEFMERMFDPFTQESEGYSKKYEGIGIGLPLTKRYLDLIGAELKVESVKGQGSTFTIIIGNISSV
ncbi:PAS domain S-box protein [Candidatus Neomarinimicrobiota bacterium]